MRRLVPACVASIRVTQPTDSRRSTHLDTRISAGQRLVELVRVGVEKGLSPSAVVVDQARPAARTRAPASRATSTAARTRGSVSLRRFPAGPNVPESIGVLPANTVVFKGDSLARG